MPLYRTLIASFWIVMAAYWLLTAAQAKRNVTDRAAGRGGAGPRVALVVVVLVLLRLAGSRAGLLENWHPNVNTNETAGLVGTIICALGVALAIWARASLGTNWGMPMAHKANPELITSGPYAYLRHPIYTGLMLAMLGPAIAVSVLWGIWLVVLGGYFVYAALKEEKRMMEQFPTQYPAYRERTRFLIPFIW
jgi:protein-S-isoprenylcysteine O-methyltransferase Ste14